MKRAGSALILRGYLLATLAIGLIAVLSPGNPLIAAPTSSASGSLSSQAASSWPGSHSGLVFLWEDASKTNQIVGTGGRAIRTCQVEPRGTARFGRHHDMVPAGGGFVARGVDGALLEACKRSHQLGFQVLITPDRVPRQGPARILTFSSGAHSRNFALGQNGDRLVLLLRTSATGARGAEPPIELGQLTAGKPHHLIISYAPGRLTWYLDGQPRKTPATVKGDFRNWTPQHLLFGEEWDGGSSWAGRLEGVAIFSRTLGPEEAKQQYALYTRRLQSRKPIDRLVVQARLTKAGSVPTVASIAPYRRALVVSEYAVEKVLQGTGDTPRLLVAEWAIMDGKRLPETRKVGESYRLQLEKFEDHPQLESERLITDSDEFDLEMFYAVEP